MPEAPLIDRLAWAGISPPLARLYAARGVSDPAEVIENKANLLPGESLLNLNLAADYIADAIKKGERFCVVADYDADGATACAIMVRGLSAMGAKVAYSVPDRMIHGYGLTPSIVSEIRDVLSPPDILITVDNGISSHAGIAAANSAGMRVIVTDHHLPGSGLPDAWCIVNPNQPDCTFASKSIAGCGVAWYLINSLARRHFPEFDADTLLPLVAIGTIADVVRLDANNRQLVSLGMSQIRQGKMPAGVKALIDVANKVPEYLTTSDIGFAIGPRINAAGRMANMSVGINCLLVDEPGDAKLLAKMLNEVNRERKEVSADIVQKIESSLTLTPPAYEKYSLSLFSPQWHEGVIGIAAGRIKEAFDRPTFVFTRTAEGKIKGSGRSIQGVHLKDVIDRVANLAPDCILVYGGHAMAAGLTLPEDGFKVFSETLERVLHQQFPEGLPTQTPWMDQHLDLDEMTREVAIDICLGVWGNGFPEPVFPGKFQIESLRRIGNDELHAAMTLVTESGDAEVEAVWFNCPDEIADGMLIDAVYRLSLNTWKGKASIQVILDPDRTRPALTSKLSARIYDIM